MFTTLLRASRSSSVSYTATRAFSASSRVNGKHALPDLAYDYSALEPVLPARVMELHHSKHHRTYVNNVNNFLEQLEEAEAKGDTAKAASLQQAIKFNAGGHINHSIYWTNLAPKNGDGGVLPDAGSPLMKAIIARYNSIENFITAFNAQTVGIQGSGWGWLVYDQGRSRVDIMTTSNQDQVSDVRGGVVPLLTIDVWEHAYYLEYENRRPDYLKNIWQIVNWKNVEERYNNALKI